MENSDLIALLRERKEGRQLDYKEDLDPSSRQHIADLAKDVAAFANTKGGTLIIGVEDRTFRPVGVPKSRLRQLTPEDLDNQLNQFIEPRVEFEVRPFTSRSKSFIALAVERCAAPPCVMKKDGNFPAKMGRTTQNAFPRGAIFVRHGAKSEPATHRDLERMFRERLAAQKRFWLKNVRRVTEAPTGSEVLIRPTTGAIRVTDDPSAPAYRGVLDTAKMESLHEELTAAVKIWKTEPTALITERQLQRFYAKRIRLSPDRERLTCLVISSLHRRMPACYWASLLPRADIRGLLAGQVSRRVYPSDQEALKLAFILGGAFAARLLGEVMGSRGHISLKNTARGLKAPTGASLADRIRLLTHRAGPSITYSLDGRSTSSKIDELLTEPTRGETVATELAAQMNKPRGADYTDKVALKRLDFGLYGPRLKGAAHD